MRAEAKALVAWAAGLVTSTAVRFLYPPAANLSATHFWLPAIGLTALCARKLAAGPALPEEIEKANLEGKVFVVTGAAAGLGYESAKFFAARGATVILGCRSVSRNEETAKRIQADLLENSSSSNAKNFKKCTLITEYAYDAENLNCVKNFASNLRSDFPQIDVLLCNAGMIDWRGNIKSRHHSSIEYTACINSLAPILLCEILKDKLKQNNTRVVSVSSMAHRRLPQDRPALQAFKDTLVGGERIFSKMSKWGRYGISKLWNIYHADYLVSQGINASTLHPGVVTTSFVVGAGWIFEQLAFLLGPWIAFKTPIEGAWTQIYMCLCNPAPASFPISPEAQKVNTLVTKKAAFYCDSVPHNNSSLSKTGNDPILAEAVMRFSLEELKGFL